MDSLKNQIAHQSETLTKLDVPTPATEASLTRPQPLNVRISEASLLDGQVLPSEKPRATAAPQYATTSNNNRNVPDTASLHQQSHQENPLAATTLHGRNDNSSSLANNGSVSVSTTVEGPKIEQDREARKDQPMDLPLANAIHEGDLMLARKLLSQGARPAEDVFTLDVNEPEQFIKNLIDADDVKTFHALTANLPPGMHAEFMNSMVFLCLNQRKEKLLEYIARHSTISHLMTDLATEDRSNRSFQALLDGGIKFEKEGLIKLVYGNTTYPPNEKRSDALPDKKSIAAQTFDAHRDRNYEEADNLFNAPAPTDENPLGMTKNAWNKLSQDGLEFVYKRVQSTQAGLISTMPDSLFVDGFRSEIVWILRSCQKECKAAREALTAQMSTNGFKLAYKTEDGNILPCNEKAVEKLLFALQLATHERLLQIAQPPLKEKENIFQTIQSGISSFFKLDKNTKARTAQAEKILALAQDVPEIILQLPQEILDIKTGVPEKTISAEIALESLQKHQETLEAQFEAIMSGTLPGTPLSEQLIIKIYGDAFKELAAIREATLKSADSVKAQ